MPHVARCLSVSGTAHNPCNEQIAGKNSHLLATSVMGLTAPLSGADLGRGRGSSGVRTAPPPPFGGHPNFIKREKALIVCARKHHFLVLNTYRDHLISEILYPPQTLNVHVIYKPSHTLRCRTPTMGRPDTPAMQQNSMRWPATHFPTCWYFCSRFWNISATYFPIFKRFSAL